MNELQIVLDIFNLLKVKNMKNKKIDKHFSLYMMHMGKIITELVKIYRSTGSSIVFNTFHRGKEFFDTLGRCIYGSLSYDKIFPQLDRFIESLDYNSDENFAPVFDYAHNLSKEMLVLLDQYNLK